MKALVVIFVLMASCARAEWNDLKVGLDAPTAVKLVGAPLFGNRSRGGTFMNWVYDNGGYILFEKGLVRFWQRPAGQTSEPQMLASAPNATPAPAAVHASARPPESAAPTRANRAKFGW